MQEVGLKVIFLIVVVYRIRVVFLNLENLDGVLE